jgi:hypothetical protein
MQSVLALFLTVAAAGAVAQQYSTASDPAKLPGSVRHSSSNTSSPNGTPSGDANLPDAPSYATQQKPLTTPQSTVYKPLLTPAGNSAASTSLVFYGGPSARSNAQPHADGANGSANCGRASPEKSDGGGWINSLLSVTSKGGHYCVLGEGGFWRRGTYAMGKAFAAHRYDNMNSFTNPAEFFAHGMTTGSASFNLYQGYAYQYDAGQRFATRYATAVGRDTLRNMLREFWPDFSSHVLNRRP